MRNEAQRALGRDSVRTQYKQDGRIPLRNSRATDDMTEEERPNALFYDQGHTAGLAGVPIDQCPYRRVAGPTRLEQLVKRVAWLEGHSDGIAKQRQAQTVAAAKPKRDKSPETIRQLGRAIAQRRYQRRQLEKAGRPERYVDRRLRQIAAEREQQVTLPTKGS